MNHTTSCEANGRPFTEDLSRLLCNPNVPYHALRNPQLSISSPVLRSRR